MEWHQLQHCNKALLDGDEIEIAYPKISLLISTSSQSVVTQNTNVFFYALVVMCGREMRPSEVFIIKDMPTT